MALWLVRAGKYGEHEARFLEQNLVCLTCRKITPQIVSEGEFTENRQVICRSCATRRIGRFDA